MAKLFPLYVAALIFICCSTVAAQNQATCDALDRLDDGSTFMLTCIRNSACSSTDCTSPQLSGLTLSLELLPCKNPPGVRFTVSQGPTVLVNEVVDQSVSGIATGLPGTTISITLNQLDSAIGLGVDLVSAGTPTTIIPTTTIPLDTASCASPIPPMPTVSVVVVPSPSSAPAPSPLPTAPPTTTVEPPPTASDGKNTTCSVLAEIAANAEGFTCTADSTEPCDTVDCNAFGHTAEFILLPCRTPAAIRLLVINQDKTVVLDETVDSSRVIIVPQLLGLSLNITLDHFEDAIGLQVIANNMLNVVKYTVVPLEKAKNCKAVNEDDKDVDPEDDPSSRSAGFQCLVFWPLLFLISLSLLFS